LAPPQKFEFGFQSAGARDLPPFFPFQETPNLKCCSEDNSASAPDKTSYKRELNSTLNPNTFPQAAQFVSNGKGDSAIGSPEETSQDEVAYASFVGGSPAGVWPGPGCANGLQNCENTPQQKPDPGLKVPEPGSLLLMLSGLSVVLVFRFAKH
jgi:hypothetical protein